MALFRLTPKDSVVTLTGTVFASQRTDIVGDFIASFEMTDLGGSATPTFTPVIEESPSPEEVLDADAVWYTLVSFAAKTANGNEKLANTTHHFSRLRVKVTVSGTTPTAKIDIIVEGEQVNLAEGNL